MAGLKIGTLLQYNDEGFVRQAQVTSFNKDGTVNIVVFESSDNPPEDQKKVVAVNEDGTPIYLHNILKPEDVSHHILFGKIGISITKNLADYAKSGACWIK